MLDCDFSNISVESCEFLSVACSPFSALYKAVALVLANDVDLAAERDSDESCCVFLFHGVVLFLGVFLKDGPPLRDSKILFEILWRVLGVLLSFLPVGPGPKLSEIVDDDRDEEGDNKKLYSDLKYHSNGFHW